MNLSRDGAELTEHLRNVVYDGILLDGYMPQDEIAAIVDAIRADGNHEHAPIAIVAPRLDTRPPRGVNLELPEPLDPEALLEAVERMIQSPPPKSPARRTERRAPDETHEGSTEPGGNDVDRLRPVAFGKLFYKASGETSPGGTICIRRGTSRLCIEIRRGRVHRMTSDYIEGDTLGSYLVRRGVITRRERDVSHERAQRAGRRQGEELVEMGAISRYDLHEALRHHILEKLLLPFSRLWRGSHVTFHEGDTLDDGVRVDLPAGVLLRDAILRHLESAAVVRALKKHLDAGKTVHVDDAFTEAARTLMLSDAERAAIFAMDGVAATEILEASPDREADSRRMFLALLTGTFRFARTNDETADVTATTFGQTRASLNAPIADVAAALASARDEIEQQRFQRACEQARHALDRDSENSSALAILAYLRNRCAIECGAECIGDPRRVLRGILADRNDCADASYYLGLLEKEDGHPDRACRLFESALRADPEYALARRQLTLSDIRHRRDKDLGYRN
ncbi:hypothetical protein K8I61_17550 [bacterium]|nr:hypothetical protein [bacterium]